MPASLPKLGSGGYFEKVLAALGRAEEVKQRGVLGAAGRLVEAARSGQEAVVELLLQQPGLDANLASPATGRTALHWACHKGYVGIVRRLLAQSSLTCHNYSNSYGQTALMMAVFNDMVGCVKEMVAVQMVDLDMDLENMARNGGSLQALEVVRRERGRREEEREVLRGMYNTLYVENGGASSTGTRGRSLEDKCLGALEKHSKQKTLLLKKAKAMEAREKLMYAADAQKAKVESVQKAFKKESEEKQRLVEAEKKATAAVNTWETRFNQTKEEMKMEVSKLEALLQEQSEQDMREEVECPVCCEEMAPPRTILQCSQGHPVCSSCRPRLASCPSCRGAFMGRAIGMEQLVKGILNRDQN